MDDYVYENGQLVPVASAMNVSTGGVFYDTVAHGLALYGQYMNAKAAAQMQDLQFQQAQLALVDKYKAQTPGTSVTAPGAAPAGAMKVSPVVLLLLAGAALYLIRKL